MSDECPRYGTFSLCPWAACEARCVGATTWTTEVTAEEFTFTSAQLDTHAAELRRLRRERTLAKILRLPGVANDPTTKQAISHILEES